MYVDILGVRSNLSTIHSSLKGYCTAIQHDLSYSKLSPINVNKTSALCKYSCRPAFRSKFQALGLYSLVHGPVNVRTVVLYSSKSFIHSLFLAETKEVPFATSPRRSFSLTWPFLSAFNPCLSYCRRRSTIGCLALRRAVASERAKSPSQAPV